MKKHVITKRTNLSQKFGNLEKKTQNSHVKKKKQKKKKKRINHLMIPLKSESSVQERQVFNRIFSKEKRKMQFPSKKKTKWFAFNNKASLSRLQ